MSVPGLSQSEQAGSYARMERGPATPLSVVAGAAGTAGLTSTARKPRKYPLHAVGDLRRQFTPARWVVKGLLPQKGLALVYGTTGAGKSFLALDLALRVSTGQPWFGHVCVKSPVVYLCLEGASGFLARLAAALRDTGGPELLRAGTDSFDLRAAEDVSSLIAAVKEWTETLHCDGKPVIIVDTLNRAMPGADESGSTDMGAVLAACARIAASLSGLVVLVHHLGKDADRGPRGHSSLLAAADAAVLVARSGRKRSWEAKKVKDGEDGEKADFELQTVPVGTDGDGAEVTSCTVLPGACVRESAGADHMPGGARLALDVLLSLTESGGKQLAEGTCIPLVAWREAFLKLCPARSDSGKRNAWLRAKEFLLSEELIHLTADGSVTLVTEASAE
jgi:putative DNA primase/helicase